MKNQENQGILTSLKEFGWAANELPLRFFGDEALHKPCETVEEHEFGSEPLKQIVALLTATLTKYRSHTGTGRGIAANQVGYTKRVVVVWLGDKPEAFINPRLVSSSGVGSYWESCMSSGSMLIGEVHRPWLGEFDYQDFDGTSHQLKADEKQTRLLLHEMDHLDGIICLERYESRTTRFIRGGKEEILCYSFKIIK
jgi:peptide deformylase